MYLHRYAWGVIKPAYARANPSLRPTDLGWLDGAFMAAYGLGQIPGAVEVAQLLGGDVGRGDLPARVAGTVLPVSP